MKTTTPSLLLTALLLTAAPARADKGAEAANFFDAGAEAYKTGQYLVAAEAFLKANELSPSPALLFSAAQSYRRQFLSAPSADVLRRSISLYRDYLRLDKAPKRREDAMQALAALMPLEIRFPADDGAAPVARATTRLLISTPATGAEVSVDNGGFVPAPLVAVVQPGAHQVRLRAAGYEEEMLAVQAVANELSPRHVVLRPKPARLVIVGTRGARVSVDGQLRATLPLTAPLAVDPGAHFVSVTLTGHEPYGTVIEVGRDATAQVAADLHITRQRAGAWATLAIGAAGGITAATLGGLALARQREAASLSDQRATAPLTPDERDRYNGALKARDDFARAAGIVGGASVVALAAGAGLFALDRPEIVPPNDDRLRAPARTGPRMELEVGVLSIGVRGTF